MLVLSGCTTGPTANQSKGTDMARLNYVELPAGQLPATREFYERAFGWQMTAYGPNYAATTTGDTDIGLHGDLSDATQSPLPVIDVPDLEAALAKVQAAGGRIVRPIFSFPGGRRFHFVDPSGNELAAVKAD